MWHTRRQTKKHKTKNRPKALAQTLLCVLGLVAVGIIVFSLVSLSRKNVLITPLSITQQVKGVQTIFVPSSTSEVERLLREKNISYLFVTTASDAAYIVTLPDNAEVLMAKDEIPLQIASLQQITTRLTMEGKRFSRLDLRFDRPVIVLK